MMRAKKFFDDKFDITPARDLYAKYENAQFVSTLDQRD